MKIASLLLTAAGVCVLASVAAADPKDDLTAVLKAQDDAPAYRVKVTTNGGGMNMNVTMERVKPGLLHIKTEGGPMVMEVYSDGQKTLMRQGADGPFQEAPPQMAEMMKQNNQQAMMLQAIQAAKNIKTAGHEAVNGTPATVYTYDAEMSGMQSSNKMWVSDKDHRPVKSESEVHGSVGATGPADGTNVNMKVVSTIDYDPSIKVVMPAK